jgi:sporulation protein YlmC with PRC-barrel domain
MSNRYIFNTSGEYVAFISDNNLFGTNLDWLGVVKNGNEVYDTAGRFLGVVLDDDRVVRNKFEVRPSIMKPLRPLTPLGPLRPLQRLRMVRLPYPYEDVFDNKKDSGPTTSAPAQSFDELIGSKIIAEDGKFLGTISFDKYSSDSLANPYGTYGSPYSSDSIFNPYGSYGSQYSTMSPFNPYSSTPPKLILDNQILGLLSANPYVFNRIDIDKFLKWWKSRI